MKILMIAAECSPFIKVNGVADIINKLPISLKKAGVDVDVVIPYYKDIEKYLNNNDIPFNTVANARIIFNEVVYSVDVIHSIIPNTNVSVYFINEPNMISNGGVYFDTEIMSNEQDVINRFAFFSKAVFEIFIKKQLTNKQYKIIHAHDWHTGMIVQLNQIEARANQDFYKPKTIFTIHNLASQGFSKLEVLQKLYIDLESDNTIKWDACDGNILFLLQALVGADYITTVSGTYAKEIQTEQYGEGLHEILLSRHDRLVGILNGIDYENYNPETDKYIYNNFSSTNYQIEKYKNKDQLLEQLNIENDNSRPVLGIISELSYQKGIDLVAEAADKITEMGYTVIIAGKGDASLEENLKNIANKNKYFSVQLTHSNELAMKIYSGSDFILIPSRYEPCGISQMISMKYGSIPIARNVGGLNDTINNEFNGYLFEKMHVNDLLNTLNLTIQTYNNKSKLNSMIQNAFTSNFSWDKSAKKYIQVYLSITKLD